MRSPNLKWYIVILLLVLILASLIFLSVNTNYLNKRTGIGNFSVQNSVAGDFSIFDSVRATLSGKITKVEGNRIYFENQKGIKGEAQVSDNIVIADLSNLDLSTPSADLKKIEINKNANMIIDIQDGKFFVLSITYPQP